MECYIIRKLYYFLTLEHLKTFYFAHFQSLLQYGIIFWGSTTTLHRVLTMRKSIIRVILGLRQRTCYRDKFKEIQILTIPSLCILQLMKIS